MIFTLSLYFFIIISKHTTLKYSKPQLESVFYMDIFLVSTYSWFFQRTERRDYVFQKIGCFLSRDSFLIAKNCYFERSTQKRCRDQGMSIVSTIFILSMTFPNEPKWHNPENSDIFNTALTVRAMNQSFAESLQFQRHFPGCTYGRQHGTVTMIGGQPLTSWELSGSRDSSQPLRQ